MYLVSYSPVPAEDIDPSVGRFRNLVQQTVIVGPAKVGST